MPVHAVIRGIQLAADEPLPERRVARVERRVPGGIPAEQVRILLEAVREMLLAEPLEDSRVSRIGLLNELRGRVVVLLLAPVHRDLRLGDLRLRTLRLLAFCHCLVLSPEDNYRRTQRQACLSFLQQAGADAELV